MKKISYNICIAMAGFAILGLSACNKPAAPADGSAGGSTPPAAAPAAAADPTAALDNGPGLKPGLWESTVMVPGMTSGMTAKMCLDEGLSKKFAQMGTSNPGKMDCSPVNATRAGGVIDVTTQCKTDGMTATMKMHMEMTGDDAYHQTIVTSYDPKMMDPTTVTVDGKFKGACPATMKAGDMDTGMGKTINMYDVAAKNKG